MGRKASEQTFGVSLFLSLVSLHSFASPSNLFKYYKRRYSDQLIHDLNRVLNLKARCVRAEENIRFLRKCLAWFVTPTSIQRRVRATRPKSPSGIERAFIKDELSRDGDILKLSLVEYRRTLVVVSRDLSFFDWLRFCKFVNKTSTRQRAQLGQKKDKILNFLNTTQNGGHQLNYCNIVNLARIDLSEVEKDVFCRG